MTTPNAYQASDVALSGPVSPVGAGPSALVVVVAAISLAFWGYSFSIDVSDGYGTQHGWLGVVAKGLLSFFLSVIVSIVSLVVTALGWKRVGLPVRVIGAIPGFVLAGCIVWVMVS